MEDDDIARCGVRGQGLVVVTTMCPHRKQAFKNAINRQASGVSVGTKQYSISFSAEAAYTLSSIYSSGRKHALRKTAKLPNRTCVGASLISWIKSHIHPNVFSAGRCQISSMHSTRKTPQKRTPKIPLRHRLVSFKNIRVLGLAAPIDVVQR